MPGGDPNHVTDDFAGHLTLEHRSGPRDLISFLDEPSASRHGVRRIPHPSRAVGAPRARRYVIIPLSLSFYNNLFINVYNIFIEFFFFFKIILYNIIL